MLSATAPGPTTRYGSRYKPGANSLLLGSSNGPATRSASGCLQHGAVVRSTRRKPHGPPPSGNHVDGKAPAAHAVTSLYGEETAEFRAWVADYIVRNKDMLDLMARL
jgi:hypothetical protein